MVIYYTFKKKTKIFAEVLGDVVDKQTYALECDLNKKSDLVFMFHALKSCFTRRTIPVSNIPNSFGEKIFVCSPVWGGEMAAPVKYFLENADLRGVNVNILLTASIPTEKYKQKAADFLTKIPCIQGKVFIFAASDKIKLEKDVITEQINEILCAE